MFSDLMGHMYVWLFSRPRLRNRNKKILNLALRAYGYNNHTSHRLTGEDFLLTEVLPRLDPRTLVDVGANVGAYSEKLLRALPNSSVYSFEPLPKSYSKLAKLSESFGQRHITINAAAGDKAQRQTLHYNPDATTHASLAPEVSKVPYVSNLDTTEIEVLTLDEYFEQNTPRSTIDFIKIDTEGFEAEVLAGAAKTIDRHRPKGIQIEYNWHQLFRNQSLYSLSSALTDYTAFQLLPDGIARRDTKDPLANVFAFSNFVFIRNDLIDTLKANGLNI
ncbi:MAG: FkbM family methyltransferase [Paracoccaceae bacterium]